jgi:hypothetical protein
MNKIAIALAADSAVTVGSDQQTKVFNTASKLFGLSRHCPVGIMVYGNAEFMGIPWETIIKIFRDKLGTCRQNTLKEYSDSFIAFLNKPNPLFPEDQQVKYMELTVWAFLKQLKKAIDEKTDAYIKDQGSNGNLEDGQIASELIEEHLQRLESLSDVYTAPEEYAQSILLRYQEKIDSLIVRVMDNTIIPENALAKLKKVTTLLFSKSEFDNPIYGRSGIVIAGFGDEEIFPSYVNLTLEGVLLDKLKYKLEHESRITFDNVAAIKAFAQKEMVTTFMEGIDPTYSNYLRDWLAEILYSYPDAIMEAIPGLSEEQKAQVLEKIRNDATEIFKRFLSERTQYIRNNQVQPIIDTVESLPKDELAAMAESLVNLTSFKRKVTLNAETVGGPIDVAVISKGDGFVWIKRKHYFDAGFNPHFLAKYYQEHRSSANLVEEGD